MAQNRAFGRARRNARADSVGRLLRAGADAQIFGSEALGRTLLLQCGGPEGAAAWLRGSVERLQPPAESRVAARRQARQWTIVRRYFCENRSRPSVCAELGISERSFFKERCVALERIADMIQAHDESSTRVAGASTIEAEFAQIDRLIAAEDTRRALDDLRSLEMRADSAAHRLAVMTRSIVALARVGRLAEARKVSRDAKRACAGTPANATAAADLLLAEMSRTRLEGDAGAYARAFDSLERLVAVACARGDQDALDRLTRGCVDRAFARVDVGDSVGAQASLDRANALLSRMHWPRADCALSVAVVQAGIDADRPSQFAHAMQRAERAFDMAEAGGYGALATQALYQCATSALVARKPNRAARFVRSLLERAQTTGNVECRIRAILAATGVDYLRARYASALQRIDAMNASEWPGANDDVTVALLRARILAGLERFGESLALLDRAWRAAESAGMEQAMGLASLWKSRVAARMSDFARARSESDASVELLQRNPTPFQLHRAYQQAFEVTAQRRYRDYAGDLWTMIAPAFDVDDDPDGESSELSQFDYRRSAAARLTTRERSVAELVCRGRTNRQIADILGIGVRTVDQHVASIMRRQNVSHRWQVAL